MSSAPDLPDLPDLPDVSWTRIEIPGTANLRDPGGYRTADGRVVRRGVLLRSEALLAAVGSEAGAVWSADHDASYRSLGLRTVVDLRTDLEAGEDPSAWARATGAEVIPMPIPEGSIGSAYDLFGRLLDGTVAAYTPADMGAYYRIMLDRRGDVFGAVVSLLSDVDRVPLLVHCSAGKDRTGLAVALVLDLLGVPREVIVADYTLTGLLRPDRVHHYAAALAEVGVGVDAARLVFETPAEAMTEALRHLDSAYGGSAGYLRAAGVTDAELAAVRDNLLES